jgi:hypothetical protein
MTHQIPKEIVTVYFRFKEQEEEEEEEEEPKTQFLANAVPVASFTVHRAHHQTPPQESIVIDDPMERYYKSLSPGEEPDPDWIIVAMESSAVHSVFALIDNSQKRECILDPGCQNIAMSKTFCHNLGLMYVRQLFYTCSPPTAVLISHLGYLATFRSRSDPSHFTFKST